MDRNVKPLHKMNRIELLQLLYAQELELSALREEAAQAAQLRAEQEARQLLADAQALYWQAQQMWGGGGYGR